MRSESAFRYCVARVRYLSLLRSRRVVPVVLMCVNTLVPLIFLTGCDD
jgi:uncharacterized membrane protein (UPF0136 family)